MPVHADEIVPTDDVVAELIASQFPQWRHLPLTRVAAAGTDNTIVRIGDALAARFPLRPADPDGTRASLRREADAAQLLAEHSPVPTPRPVAVGEPGPGYPLPWSVQTWVPGTVAGAHGFVDLARDLAAFVRALRSVDLGGRVFTGDRRGGDLRTHDDWMETCFARSVDLLDVARLREVWRGFRDLPRRAPDVLTHGDLIPGNVLTDGGGRLAGVLDGGGSGPADPALDLIAAWHLFDAGPRTVFRAALGCDDLEWERGRAWAFEQSMGAVWYYVDTLPAMAELGRRTLRRIVESSAGN